jgi:hypothetical protein
MSFPCHNLANPLLHGLLFQAIPFLDALSDHMNGLSLKCMGLITYTVLQVVHILCFLTI